MNKQVCYWERTGDPDHERPWKGQCGGEAWEISFSWEYCPFCGRRIYIREKITHDMKGRRRMSA